MNTDARFTELETKLVYCEDLIQQLDAALSAQQLQVDDLRLAVKVLSERLKEVVAPQQRALMPDDERPPHY